MVLTCWRRGSVLALFTRFTAPIFAPWTRARRAWSSEAVLKKSSRRIAGWVGGWVWVGWWGGQAMDERRGGHRQPQPFSYTDRGALSHMPRPLCAGSKPRRALRCFGTESARQTHRRAFGEKPASTACLPACARRHVSPPTHPPTHPPQPHPPSNRPTNALTPLSMRPSSFLYSTLVMLCLFTNSLSRAAPTAAFAAAPWGFRVGAPSSTVVSSTYTRRMGSVAMVRGRVGGWMGCGWMSR